MVGGAVDEISISRTYIFPPSPPSPQLTNSPPPALTTTHRPPPSPLLLITNSPPPLLLTNSPSLLLTNSPPLLHLWEVQQEQSTTPTTKNYNYTYESTKNYITGSSAETKNYTYEKFSRNKELHLREVQQKQRTTATGSSAETKNYSYGKFSRNKELHLRELGQGAIRNLKLRDMRRQFDINEKEERVVTGRASDVSSWEHGPS